MIWESTVEPGEDYLAVVDEAQDLGMTEIYLVEMLFHSNEEDEKLLLDDNNLHILAELIYQWPCEKYSVENIYGMRITKGNTKHC